MQIQCILSILQFQITSIDQEALNTIPKEMLEQLIDKAIAVAQNAYCTYSKYHVGAAFCTEANDIFIGANWENAAYPSGLCAERSAISNMIANKGAQKIKFLVVATKNGGSCCGACRQALFEFGPKMIIVQVKFDRTITACTRMEKYLLGGFGPENL